MIIDIVLSIVGISLMIIIILINNKILRIGGFPQRIKTMLLKGLQINLNKSWGAQDLMVQLCMEEEVRYCLISEPAGQLGSNSWNYSSNLLAAIYIPNSAAFPHFTLFRRTQNCIAVRFKDIIIISVYISPSVNSGIYRRLTRLVT